MNSEKTEELGAGTKFAILQGTILLTLEKHGKSVSQGQKIDG